MFSTYHLKKPNWEIKQKKGEKSRWEKKFLLIFIIIFGITYITPAFMKAFRLAYHKKKFGSIILLVSIIIHSSSTVLNFYDLHELWGTFLTFHELGTYHRFHIWHIRPPSIFKKVRAVLSFFFIRIRILRLCYVLVWFGYTCGLTQMFFGI